MAANGGFVLSKSAIFTFCVGIVFGFAFTYFFAFSSVNNSQLPAVTNRFTSSGSGLYIPMDPHSHGELDVKGPTETVKWSDHLAHSHRGIYIKRFS
jgi:hypothetical protein